jgi:MFS family permease
MALAATAYAFAVTMLGTTLPTPLYALYRERFGFSQLMITVIFATYAVGVISALLLFGRLSDDIGRRRALLPGLVLSALSAVAFLLLHGLGLILLGRMLSGLSAGIFTGTATAAITDLAGEGGAARATLIATIANIGGLGCGPLLAGILAEWAPDPLRLVFIVERPEFRLRPQRPGVPEETRAVFVPASLAGFAGFSVLGLFTAVSPAFLATILGVTNLAAIGLVVFVVFASSAVGQVLAGSIAQRRALVGGCATLAVGVAVLGASLAVSSLVLLIAGGVLAGLGQGMSFRASIGAVTGAAPPDRRGETSSAFFIVAYVAISLPVVGVGALAQATSLRTAGLVFSAVVVVIAATASALLASITGK